MTLTHPFTANDPLASREVPVTVLLYFVALALFPLQAAAWAMARKLIPGTSLPLAWYWAIPALVVWPVTVIAAFRPSGLLDHLTFASIVLLVAPFVGVLGARRPGVHAWGWFVLLPMIVVLQWPAVSSVLMGSVHEAFELPTMAMLGCGLVIVMSLGNYFGTRFMWSALAYAGGLFGMLRPLAQADTARAENAVPVAVAIGSIALSVSAILFLYHARRWNLASARATTVTEKLSLAWVDFRELFGMVWAKRVMDRMNNYGQRERWPFQVRMDGFSRREPEPEACATDEEAVEKIRWLWRHYVDSDWLDRHLN